MKLLDYYKEICNNSVLNNIYYSTGDTQIEGRGKIFSFFNTNYRTLLTKQKMEYKGFGQGFKLINSMKDIPYQNWERYENNDEIKLKQHTVRMRKAELFTVQNGIYKKTRRGEVFERMLNSKENILNDDEKKFICYLLILTGYFSNTKNYIIERTKAAFYHFNISGYKDSEILKMQKQFLLSIKEMTKTEFLSLDYPYIDSFCFQYNEIDFNKMFLNSNEKEKNELKQYVIDNVKNARTNCILSHKYVAGGNYTKTTLEDSTMILFVTKNLLDSVVNSFENFLEILINSYSEIYGVRSECIYNFINDSENISVFKAIYNNIYNFALMENINTDIILNEIKNRKHLRKHTKKIDVTDVEGQKENEIVSNALKKLAKANSHYKCIMEDIECCKYFTSKENNQNYLEIHHFIPREFANDFDESIEFLGNYIPLCPHCHRKIHLAVDRERK